MPNPDHNRELTPEPGWLDRTLGAFFAPRRSSAVADAAPSPEFAERCHAAAWRALDVARMRRQRPKVSGILASLRDHFAALARLAGARIEDVYAYLAVREGDDCEIETVRGMARLARLLGLEVEEVRLRLRVGFALSGHSPATSALTSALAPALAHLDHGSAAPPRIESLVRACEANYDAERREQVARALNATASVFTDEDEG